MVGDLGEGEKGPLPKGGEEDMLILASFLAYLMSHCLSLPIFLRLACEDSR